MKIGSINYHFIVYKSKINKQGKVPLYCRLRKNNEVLWLSTSLKISPNDYNSSNEELIGGPKINRQLFDAWKNKLHQVLLNVFTNNIDCSLNEIKAQLVGTSQKKKDKGILEIFEHHNSNVKRLVGKDYSIRTYDKYKLICNQFRQFLKDKKKVKDVPIKKVGLAHLIEFEEYLLIDRKLKQITVNKSTQRLKKIVKYAQGHDWLDRNPWILHKQKSVQTQIIYLTKDELQCFIDANDLQERLQNVNDLFVFQCFTGLGYAELSTFNGLPIETRDNISWVKIKRHKTKKTYNLPLLKPALVILNKYSFELPYLSIQKYNQYLKELAKLYKIDKKLSSHIARKTMATTVLISNNIPLKVASRLLAHADSRVTEKHYAEVNTDYLKSHVEKLNKIY